ncbi:MAG: hypothetical protein U1E13_00410 [Methylophilaceae bacterium]|nr:hypothetical protein [Methylophilaceae bacterium]
MLDKLTREFFERHWQKSFGPEPTWSEPWSVIGQGPVPNGDKQGCYFLYQGPNPFYLGLGVSRGSGLYREHGIGIRLYGHVLCIDASKGIQNNKGFYMPREKWKSVTHLRTIGFPSGYGYLAPSLELFLLNTLPSSFIVANTLRPGAAVGKS